jgi:hypothetical protein
MVEPAPNKTVKLRNLVPGKRYRMVVDVVGSPFLSAPSIEFTVPPSPRLISTYQPTVKIVEEPYTVQIAKEFPVVTTVNIPAKNHAQTITRFGATNNSNKYSLRIPGTKPPIGAVVRISGRSQIWGTTDPLYYDWLDYKVTSINGNEVKCTGTPGYRAKHGEGSRVKWGGAPWNKNSGGYRKTQHWDDSGNNGKAFDDPDSTKSGMVAYWYTGPESYRVDGGVEIKYVPELRKKYRAEVSLPQEIIDSGIFNSDSKGIYRYLPVFFYIKGGRYYNLDDTEVTSFPALPLARSFFPNPIPVTQTDFDMGNDTSRSYVFTIARYKDNTTSWIPTWMQVTNLYEGNPRMQNVVLSQPARRI